MASRSTLATSFIKAIEPAALLYGYAVVLCALFQFAFWQCLDFNIFSWMSLGDLLASPIQNLLGMLLPTAALAMLAADFHDKEKDRYYWADLAVYGWTIMFTVMGPMWFYLFMVSEKISVGVMMVNVTVMAVFIAIAVFAARIIKSGKRSNNLVYFATVMPLLMSILLGSFTAMATFAEAHRFGWTTKIACKNEEPAEWGLIMKLGEHAFLMNQSRELCITSDLDFKLTHKRWEASPK